MKHITSNHTFAVCAYEKSNYLEDCIKSTLNQTLKSEVIICTSTPNDFIRSLAQKYNLKIFINDKEKVGVVGDWNFAYRCASTDLVTICHQDDIYGENYVKEMLKAINNYDDLLIFMSNYYERRGNIVEKNNILLTIKRIMLFPLRYKIFQRAKWVRRLILSLGCPICCPSVAFHKKKLFNEIFTSRYIAILDWDAWERISHYQGRFVYSNKPLMEHRIHEESATTEVIKSNVRKKEEIEMFQKFWGKLASTVIHKIYSKSEKSNDIRER